MVVGILRVDMGVANNPDMAIRTFWKPLGVILYRSLVKSCGLSPYLLKLYLQTGYLWSEPAFEVIWYHFGFAYLQPWFLSWFHKNSLPLSKMQRERRMQYFGAGIKYMCFNLLRQKAQTAKYCPGLWVFVS